MFQKGDQVIELGTIGAVGTIVSGPTVHGGESYYRVNFNGRVKNIPAEDLLVYTGELDPESLLRAGQFGDHVTFKRRLTMSKLRRPLRDTIYSYKASRTEFHAYQFKPLLKFLASEKRRLLIADEVGLGKTIEAGYILQEERARFAIQRVLVVCPASLRVKWQNELWQRFGEDFEILDRAGFMQKAILKAGATDRGLPRLAGIVSLQSLRSNAVIEAIEERAAPLDLLIVDEAHHCRNPETKQHRVVRSLSESSEATILLTATPIHLGDENLFSLLRLLLPEEFDKFGAFRDRLEVNRHIVEAEASIRRGGDAWEERTLGHLTGVEATFQSERFRANPLYSETVDMLRRAPITDRASIVSVQDNITQLNLLTPVMTRTRKRDVYPDAAKRSPQVVRVDMSAAERAAYERLSEYCFDKYAASAGDFAAQFALITLQRQLASSLHAMLEFHAHKPMTVADLDFEDDELDSAVDDDSEEPDTSKGGLPGKADFYSLVGEFADILNGPDSKLEALLRILRSQEKVVVFSYFKRSLRYLERALGKAGIGCTRIDGDVPTNPHDPEADERSLRIERFRDQPSVRVLLSSEVGSEGLDFQFCHVLVNWDLPWNPMVVEQRIGRLDRLGQKSEKILIFSFSCPDTIEDVILQRLYTRIGVFERTIGVLEPILGQEIKELTEHLFGAKLTPAEREQVIEERARALAQRARDEERLEAEAANLVGQDEFFTEQIDRVRRLGRFVTGEELRLLVTEFLQTEFPTCALRQPQSQVADEVSREPTDTWRLKVNEQLKDFVRRPLVRNDPGLVQFLERAHSGELSITFDAQVALSRPAVDLINANHPLVRAIAKYYDEKPTLVHPVTAVTVGSATVPTGEYLFLWASVEETGIRAGRTLWAVLVEAGGNGVPDAETSETLLHEMILRGERWDDFEAPPAEFTEQLLTKGIEAIVARHQAYRVSIRRRNNGLVEQRLASLDATYRTKKEERERRLFENRVRGNDRAVTLFEAQLRKLESDFDEATRRVEAQREVSVSWNIEGGGYVRVVPEIQ